MKFLCLPGAYGSAKASQSPVQTPELDSFFEPASNILPLANHPLQNFRVQLGPLASELERRGLASFVYSQGTHEVEPPAGWEDYFGTRPLYRFLDTRQGDNFDNLRRIRYVPHSMNAEDAMRMFQDCGGEGEDWHQQVWRDALDGVMKTVDENPEVDAIIGYSEGAMVGASLVVEEAEQEKRTGRKRRIKFAVFISGAPPLKFEGKDRIVAQLVDEAGVVIDIPTFHIFGCDDAFLSSAVALFNVCEPSKATLYDHGLGHIVPRDAENVRMLGDIFEELLPKIASEHENRREAGMACLGDGMNGCEVEGTTSKLVAELETCGRCEA